jgi:hypothetical protein
MPDSTLVVRLGSILVLPGILPGIGTYQPCLRISHRWETHVCARCSQGGGIYVISNTVTIMSIMSSSITGNTAAGSVCAHVQNFPWPPWETHVGSLFAGWWCLCLFRHSDHLIVHHQWEHSWLCARSSSKVPIAPMGKLLTRLPRLSLAQLRPMLRSTTECTCRTQRP